MRFSLARSCGGSDFAAAAEVSSPAGRLFRQQVLERSRAIQITRFAVDPEKFRPDAQTFPTCSANLIAGSSFRRSVFALVANRIIV